jgi:large subunit ribosomal protein L2
MLRKFKPVTPGQRHKLRIIKSPKDKILYKELVRVGRIGTRKPSFAGRNQTGRITVRGRGGGERRRVRVIDYNREEGVYSEGVVRSIQYNPSTTAKVAIINNIESLKS